jgi:hypothetical protein
MKSLSEHSEKILESLRNSVRAKLERKKRLGQYAVVWKDGKLQYIGKNENAKDEIEPDQL